MHRDDVLMTGRVVDGFDVQRRALLLIAASILVLAAPVSVADSVEEGNADLPHDLARALRDYDQANLSSSTNVRQYSRAAGLIRGHFWGHLTPSGGISFSFA
jgi:hypothetical protein